MSGRDGSGWTGLERWREGVSLGENLKRMAKVPPELPRERRTVYNMLDATAEFLGSAPALHQPQGGGTYKSWNWIEYRQIAEEVAAGLRSLGVGHGDICGLASETRAEFYLADVGVMTNGSIAAAVYTSLPAADQVKTLKAAEPKAIFVENPKMLQALESAGLNEVKAQRILFSGEAEGAISLDRLGQLGAQAMVEDPGLLERIRGGVRPEDMAILYLTSGATGEPKMGLVSHNSVLVNCAMGPAEPGSQQHGFDAGVSAFGAHHAAAGAGTAGNAARHPGVVQRGLVEDAG